MRVHRYGWGRAALTILGMASWLGCGMLQASRAGEPGVLVIRNSSGRDIERVSLSPAERRRDGTARHGSLSPVPRGVSQIVVRPSNAPPLADLVNVEWTEVGGRVYAVRHDLRPTLREARGGREEALVFELLPNGSLATHLERRPAPW